MNKKTITILGIIVLAIIAGSFWFLQRNNKQSTEPIKQEITKQTQEQKTTKEAKKQSNSQNQIIDGELKPEGKIDTSDWKTYYNKNCRIQFKYPPNYHLVKYAEKPDDCNVWVTKKLGSNSGHDIRVQYVTSFVWKDVYLKCDQQSEKYKDIRWFFVCPVDEDYIAYKKLIKNNDCDNISIQLADKRHLLEHNVEHGISVECESGNANDAKAVKEILRSFKFF